MDHYHVAEVDVLKTRLVLESAMVLAGKAYST